MFIVLNTITYKILTTTNPKNKTTITVVGLKQSNRWEYHHPPTTTGTQNYMI